MKHFARFLFAFGLSAGLAALGNPALSDCIKLPVDVRGEAALQAVTPPPENGCTVGISRDNPIPDPRCTPGAINPTVTLDILRSPDFRPSCLRDKATSARVKTASYERYRLPNPATDTGADRACKLDHLVSLELGGADTLDNIWPQCAPTDARQRARISHRKRAVDTYLIAQVKAGTIPLEEAQRGIARDWTQYLDAACENQRCD